MDLKLEGRNALVVASSRGLGKAIAQNLLQEGANVVITGRDEIKLKKTMQELRDLNRGNVSCKACDITNYEEIKELVQFARGEFGKIDVLINNSGGPPAGKFTELTDDSWEEAFELTLLSYIRFVREVLPDMKEKGGKIINLASSSVKQPIPGLILSNVFRNGVVGLSKTLASELAPFNILVNVVGPGLILTDRLESIQKEEAEQKGITKEALIKEQLGKVPLGRYGTANEFAKIVTFLASGMNTYVTGETILIDGGMINSI
ncbi:SDR family oxidoreductase [Sporosarcina aquimarina]|uniref:SDR family oxidoreductase n=1 Tax=Sporosarcina aquimarina TaxID=114975 RepID=UPI001C8D0C19|nr:SDR family oxidoreductase [Sporosarcina aquimarina]